MFWKSLCTTLITCIVGLAAWVSAAPPAGAETYPSKAIRIVVPFSAGGATDIMTRVVGDKLQARWGQPVVIENRTGAGGTLGALSVARADADGYTLLTGTSATHAIAPSIYPNLQYDPEKDFAPITLISSIPLVLTAHPSVPVTTVSELISYVKANPGKVDFASSGNGSITHLSSELFAYMAGIKMTHVPYRGSAPAVTDLLSGQVKMMIDHTPTVLAHVKSGRLKALGVAEPARLDDLPDTPTIAESGVPGYAVKSWVGLVAPAGTPAAVVQKLNDAVLEILRMPDVQNQLKLQGARPYPTTPQEFAKVISADRKQWQDVVTRAGIQQ